MRQKYMHTSNYGHNGIPSVSRYAAAQHKQRSRLHLGVLGVLAAKLRGAATDLGRDKGAQGPGYLADTHYAGKDSRHAPLCLSAVSVLVLPPSPSSSFLSSCSSAIVAICIVNVITRPVISESRKSARYIQICFDDLYIYCIILEISRFAIQ